MSTMIQRRRQRRRRQQQQKHGNSVTRMNWTVHHQSPVGVVVVVIITISLTALLIGVTSLDKVSATSITSDRTSKTDEHNVVFYNNNQNKPCGRHRNNLRQSSTDKSNIVPGHHPDEQQQHTSDDKDHRSLIVGGTNATLGRYPYFVALVNGKNETVCGGTLIAPDVVLTAAHCRSSGIDFAMVGKYYYDMNNYGDGYERIDIHDPYDMGGTADYMQANDHATVDPKGFVHPLHSYRERTYDVMLLKLVSPSRSGRLMTVNFDRNIPAHGNGNEITVIGMGRLQVGGDKPEILQQVHLDFVPYDDCIDITSYNVDYKYEVMPDMICSTGRGIYGNRGQCYGDSGGPYIVLGNTPENDLQIGVVSWAVNCANPVLPMVGARTSMPATATFIRQVACEIGTNVPSYLCGADSTAGSGIINADMMDSIANPIQLFVNLFFDPFPHEISISIQNTAKTIEYAYVPFEDHIGIDHALHQVILPAGEDCILIILDARDDGIFGDEETTAYEIAYGKTVIASGNGKFNTYREEPFRVPTILDNGVMIDGKLVSTQQGGDSSNTNPTPSNLPPQPGSITVYVYFEFDKYQEDLSWSISDSIVTSLTYKDVEPNTYQKGTEVKEELSLPGGKMYYFTVNDRKGTDEYRAFKSFRLSYIDPQSGDEVTLVDNQGGFTGESETMEFTLPGMAGYHMNPQSVDLQPATNGVDPSLTTPPVVGVGPPGQEQTVCLALGNQCSGSNMCCSGRCVGQICRNSQTAVGRNRVGLRLGRTRAGLGGGATSRSAAQPP